MRVLFALSGLHRVRRGAEVAFESIGEALAESGVDVTLLGSGPPVDGRSYRYKGTRVVPRERFERAPSLPPVLRSEYVYEELTFVPGMVRHIRPRDYDVTVTCGYPYTNWVLRALGGRRRPRHVFVTQNGDWPARENRREFRLFGCDGLVCTNPGYFEANRDRWRCALIPNGVDPDRFRPGPPERERFGLDADRPVVLMVSALIASKRVAEAVSVVSRCPDVMLVVAGDGPERDAIDEQAARELPGRFRRLVVDPAEMPALYRSVDALLHMSIDEPFGNAYIEAGACGVPVVGHRTASTEWILGTDGHLVDTNDFDSVADTLQAVIAAPAADVAERSSRFHERFGWPTVAAQYREFLEEVVREDGALGS